MGVRSKALDSPLHRYLTITVHNLYLCNILHLIAYDDPVWLTRIQRIRCAVRNLLGSSIAALKISPEVKHVDQVQWPMDDKPAVTLDFLTPFFGVMDLVGVECQGREPE